MSRARWSAVFDAFCYFALTILVWGVNALQRGMWQDDLVPLAEAFVRSGSFLALLAPEVSPLRRLTVLPSAIALATPHPIWALQFLCASIWLGQALLAGWITRLLLPGRGRTQFLVICLTLTATSDLTTGSMLTLAYNFAALQLLASAGCALVWLDSGRQLAQRSIALTGSVLLLLGSLLTVDVAVPAIPFLVLLFVLLAVSAARAEMPTMKRPQWNVAAAGPTRRLIILLVSWSVVLVPIAIAEWKFLHDPTSYAAVALVPMSKSALAGRALMLWLVNFTPWRWVFSRPAWWVRPAPVIPMAWMVAGSLAALSICFIRLRAKGDHDTTEDRSRRVLLLVPLFVTMALAANAVYALVQFSEHWYRTHILSRIWASMAIGMLAGWAATRTRVLRWLAYACVAAFVFFGTWGGFERQDYFLSVWRWHQRELMSILHAAPDLRAGTSLILRGTPPSGRYLATEADYLARCWLILLYEGRDIRMLRLNPSRGTGCIHGAGGLDCWLEGEATCFAAKTCLPFHATFDTLVLMDYDAGSGTYRLVSSLKGDPLAAGGESDAQLYHPEQRIVRRPLTTRQRRLLLQ